jgi:hypothetical protein
MKRYLIGLMLSAIFIFSPANNAWAERRALGDLGFDPVEYRKTLKQYPSYLQMALPVSFDWRDYGVNAPVEDQGDCGACWSFASTGVMTSKILMAGGGYHWISEQQLISCNTEMSGCCGGDYTALKYWYNHEPFEKYYEGTYCSSSMEYAESRTQCPPTESTYPCWSYSGFQEGTLPYRASNVFTVDTTNPNNIKASLYSDGPAYFRYDVYEDFQTFWNSAPAGSVYRQVSGAFSGGHAVLIIGWDDSKQAWLCRNSWGVSGPNRDGTFWIAWSGHAHDLKFGMANIDLKYEWDQIELYEGGKGKKIVSASGNGFTIAGEKNGIWLFNTSPYGNGWEKTYNRGVGGSERVYDLDNTNNGGNLGYVIVGSTKHITNGTNDIWLIKTDETGNKSWDYTFEGGDPRAGYSNDVGYGVEQTSDGGYIVVGKKTVFTPVENRLWLIKTDSLGKMLWERFYRGVGYDIKQTRDGGYIIGGTEGGVSLLIKTDGEGNLVKQAYLGDGEVISVGLSRDGGYITLRNMDVRDLGPCIGLTKIRSDLSVEWTNHYSRGFAHIGDSVLSAGNGYILSAFEGYEREEYSCSKPPGLLVKTDYCHVTCQVSDKDA